jgi:hypothetical protein
VFSNLLRPLAWLTASLSLLTAALSVSTHWTSASAKSNPGVPVANPVVTPAANKDDNPTVTPGLVKWHKSFEAAKTASLKSGKPVFLFHMMGQLDKQFC